MQNPPPSPFRKLCFTHKSPAGHEGAFLECRISNIEQQNDEVFTSAFEIPCSTCPQCLCVVCSNIVMGHYYDNYHLNTHCDAWQAGILRFMEFDSHKKPTLL
jgi:hypothetical protein